jgi:hypothetical protein
MASGVLIHSVGIISKFAMIEKKWSREDSTQRTVLLLDLWVSVRAAGWNSWAHCLGASSRVVCRGNVAFHL